MRLILAMVLAGLVASPLSVSAQADEEATSSEPALQEPAPSTEPAPKEPALQVKLDDAGVEVAPTPPRTVDGYTREEMNHRVDRARGGLVGTSVVTLIGALLVVTGATYPESDPDAFTKDPTGAILLGFGGAVSGLGAVGMITCGALLGVRKNKLRELQQAYYGTPRRVQWDLARSRLVF